MSYEVFLAVNLNLAFTNTALSVFPESIDSKRFIELFTHDVKEFWP